MQEKYFLPTTTPIETSARDQTIQHSCVGIRLELLYIANKIGHGQLRNHDERGWGLENAVSGLTNKEISDGTARRTSVQA